MRDMDTTEAPQSIDALSPDDTGRWLVTTQGSRHIWDLDQRTYQRLPGEGRSSFAHDGGIMTLTRVERWPAVGNTSFIWFDDPTEPHMIEHWRQSSTIVSIERLEDEPEQPAVQNPYGQCDHTKYEGCPPCVHSAWDEGYAAAQAFYTNACFFCGPADEYSTWACETCLADPANQWFTDKS